MHFRKYIRAITENRATLLDLQDMAGDPSNLLLVNVQQRCYEDPQRESVLGQDFTRALQSKEGIVRDHRASTGRQMLGETFKKRIEQAAPVGTAPAPAWQAAGTRNVVGGKMRKIGDNQVEPAAGYRLPHVATMEFGDVFVAQAIRQAPAGMDCLRLNVDTA